MKNKLIGFVVSMEKEAKLILDTAQIKEKFNIANKDIFLGEFFNYNFVMIIAGIGKVNSALSTQLLLDKFSPELIINFGVAGGKQGSNLTAGDIVQVEKVCQYDFDLSELDDVNIGYMQDFDLTYFPVKTIQSLENIYPLVTATTGDRFTAQKYFLDIMKNLKAQIVDMECGAIAQVCYTNNIELMIVKLISDVDGNDNSIYSQYANNVKSVCEKIPTAIKTILENLE